jgi:hypothetical protein
VKATDWINIVAILVAPLVAVQLSLWLERRKQRRLRQLETFRTLMATRASGLAPDHVKALNMIDVEFYGSDKGSKAVLQAWRAYLDHLNMAATPSEAWGTRREDLLVDLLQAMAMHLGFEFDRTAIRRTSYFPRGYGEAELEQLEIRKLLLAILRGERGFRSTSRGPSRTLQRSLRHPTQRPCQTRPPRNSVEAVHLQPPNKPLQRPGFAGR